jgi:hypothetical protein
VYRAILHAGDSNTGGEALVSSLPPNIMVPDPRVQILIVPNSRGYAGVGTFETLAPGVNHNLDHSGYDPTYHSWEMGWREYLDANPTQTTPVYNIQAGQGGSGFTQWLNGGDGITRCQQRLTLAQAQFTTMGIDTVWECFFSLGINEFISGGSITPAAYEAGMIQVVADIRAAAGRTPAQMRFRSPSFLSLSFAPTYPTLVAVHENLPNLIENFQVVDTTGISEMDLYHWASLGRRQMLARLAAPT